MNHLTPSRIAEIIDSSKITDAEIAHVSQCVHCNGSLRAYAAMASTEGKEIAFRDCARSTFKVDFSNCDTDSNVYAVLEVRH